MSVLGFSHLVSEITSLEATKAHYSLLGYCPEFSVRQPVEAEKQKILDSVQEEVELTYLKHRSAARIGIEVIRHKASPGISAAHKIIYGTSAIVPEIKIDTDPDGNTLVTIPRRSTGPHQHILIPTSKFEETVEFYRTQFFLDNLNNTESYSRVYAELNLEFHRTLTLGLKKCLFRGWDVALHIVEVSGVTQEIYLNQIGFSCFCLIVDQHELSRLKNLDVDMIGPIFGKKNVNGAEANFGYCFIRDPNRFLVELYIPM